MVMIRIKGRRFWYSRAESSWA